MRKRHDILETTFAEYGVKRGKDQYVNASRVLREFSRLASSAMVRGEDYVTVHIELAALLAFIIDTKILPLILEEDEDDGTNGR